MKSRARFLLVVLLSGILLVGLGSSAAARGHFDHLPGIGPLMRGLAHAVARIQTQLNTLEGTVDGLGIDVTDLQGALGGLGRDVTSAQNDLSTLLDTLCEGNPASCFPAFCPCFSAQDLLTELDPSYCVHLYTRYDGSPPGEAIAFFPGLASVQTIALEEDDSSRQESLVFRGFLAELYECRVPNTSTKIDINFSAARLCAQIVERALGPCVDRSQEEF